MWSISAIKEKARERKTTNRWKMILAGFVLTLALGTNVLANLSLTWLTEDDSQQTYQETVYDGGQYYDDAQLYDDTQLYDGSRPYDDSGLYNVPQPRSEMEYQEDFQGQESGSLGTSVLGWMIFAAFLILILVLVLLIFIPLNILLLNPLSVGGRRFFYRNIKEDAQAQELCYTFDHGYKNSVKILFFRDLYLFLWTLLLIVPGIIKSYEYRLIPYLLAEYPQMSREEVFDRSREWMRGNKWKAFLLDLSFLGWRILNVFTLGILGIFYLDPYYHQADAMMYDAIRYEKEYQNTFRGQETGRE